MNPWAVIPLVSCIAYVALLALVLLQIGRLANRSVIIFLLAAGTWSLTSFMLTYNLSASTQTLIFWNGLLFTAVAWTVVAYFHFIRAYNNKSAGVWVYIGYAIILTMLVFAFRGDIVTDASIVNGYLHHDVGYWVFITSAILLPIYGSTLWMLSQRYRRSVDPVDRTRTAYLIMGLGIMGIWSAVNVSVPRLSLLPTDHTGVLFNALIIAYVIGKYQLFNIRLVVRRGLTYILLIAVLVGVYVGVMFLSFTAFPAMPLIALATVMALVLVLAARPLRYAIQEGIDRLFYRKTYEHRQALLGFSSNMGNILNLDELAKEMLPAVTKALNVTQASLLLEDISSGDFAIHFAHPKDKDESSDEVRFGTDNPVVAWLEREARPLDLKQIDSIPAFKGLWQVEREKLANSRLELLCPIKSRGRLVGILALNGKRSGGIYSHEDIEMVTSLAGQAGIIIENAYLFTQATIRANTDGLTQLYNHRQFHERLEQEIARGSRFGAVFSIIMLDIDLFKVYNDIYGHLAGDRILRKIADFIKSSVRKLDTPFRYGGEEFAVILPEARLDNAYRVAERIRRTIESQASSKTMPVTVSLGVASWPSDGVTKEEIVGCADAALYRAKQTGRNQTCLSSDIAKPVTPMIGEELEAQRGALNIIYALAATVDAKDHYTYGHSKKVSEYSVAICEAIGLPGDRVTIIRAAALLHDIGKIGIPDSILNKEGTLTEKEWEQVKAHPQDGTEILRHIINLVNCLPAILHHHEHFDGSGYPTGLKADEIPMEARILAVADAYDAMTSLRPYRERLAPKQAIDELRRCSGTQFDPVMVDIFCKLMQPTLAKELEIR